MFNDDYSHQIHLFKGYTLVDITKTNVTRSDVTSSIPRNQQRNWETLIQVLGLRTQPTMFGDPEIIMADASVFDPVYHGTQKIWVFKFGVEYDDIFETSTSKFGILEQDSSNVPIITGLTESVTFSIPIFDATGCKNIYFESIKL